MDTEEKGAFDILKDRVVERISEHFPVHGSKHSLLLDKIWVDDNLDKGDVESQLQAKNNDDTWGVPVRGLMRLIDNKTGQVLSKQTVQLAKLPKMTSRYSFIIDGGEYQVDHLLRLKSGVYTRIASNGDMRSEFNLRKGGNKNFSIELNRNTKALEFVRKGTNAHVPVYPLMKVLGVSDDDMERGWGKEIFEANRVKNERAFEQSLVKFWRRTAEDGATGEPPPLEKLKEHAFDYFEHGELYPDITKVTLGQPFDRANGKALLAASTKLLNVSRGTEVPDDRDSLVFKEVAHVEDFIPEFMKRKEKWIKHKIRQSIDSKKEVSQILQGGEVFKSPIIEFFTKGGNVSERGEQTNPLTMLSGHFKTTTVAPDFGGIKHPENLKDDMRAINPSHFGFLDVTHTPECHDELTEVFTRRGWVRWADVSKDDLFLCRHGDSSFFAKADRLVVELYRGTMYGMDNGKISYLVTPNHRMWTVPNPPRGSSQYRFVSADMVHGRPRRFQVAHPPAKTGELTEFLIPTVKGDSKTQNVSSVDMRLWAEFMGWFLSEGSATFLEDKGTYKVAISQDKQANPEKYELIRVLLSKLPFGEWGEEKDGRGFYLGRKQLAAYLSKFGYCNDKYIPEEIFSASVEAREAFIEAMLLGDGRTFSNRQPSSPVKSYSQKVFCTTSPRLAADFEKLATMMGYSASTKKYADDREERYLDVYEVRLLRHKERVARPFDPTRASRQHTTFLNHYFTQQYDGMVYCASVPGGLLFTRRPGRLGMWSGNSERTGITLHLGTAVKKKGHDLTTPVYNLKTKKTEYLNVPKFYEAPVVLPDQVTWEKGKPRPISDSVRVKLPGGEIGSLSFKNVKYVMPSTKGMFSFVTNTIPFLPSDQGNRVSMADKQIEQAISLKHREAPLVQSASSSKGTDTYERMLGGFTSSKSPVSGQVAEVGSHAVKVKSGRSTVSVPLYHYFPLNDPKAMLHSEPLVKPGDHVEKGQVVADSNFTRGGKLAIGTNLLVGYLPYRGYNFEDGIVISQSAAQKFTSEHLHTLPIEFEPEDKRNKHEWLAFNSKKARDLAPEQLALLDTDGVIKPGSRVKPGQVLVTALSPNYDEQDPSMVAAYKTRGMRLYKDKSLSWDEDVEGVVTRVVKAKSGRKVKVYVKTDEAAVVGDKITGRHGDKGIITAILPDEEMPYVLDPQSKEKRPLQVLLNPLGVPTRMNVGQVLETAAGKIAAKTGKPYVVDNFGSPHGDNRAQVMEDLKKHGLSDEELVYDPKYPGRPLGSVLVGPKYLLKLKHQVEKKLSVRGGGTDLFNRPYGYTLDKQPEQGGARGGQGFGALESYSLLAHNARHNLRELATYKSDMQSEDFWERIMRGEEPPPPRVPFSYTKFEGLVKGLGVDTKKEGTTVRLTPMTDKDVLKLADNGKNEIRDGTRILLARAAPALRPEKGGLFDTHATGGLGGTKWSFIRMAEPMPNPLFVGSEQQRGPIPALLGLRVEDIDDVMAGKKAIDGKVGGRAVLEALKKIDVDHEIKVTREAMGHKRGDALDRLNRKLKVLQSLKAEGQKPHEAYVLNYLPVVPPVLRPITKTRSTIAQSGLNNLYRNFANLNQSLGTFNEYIPDSTKNEVRQRLWNGFKALQSVGKFDPIYDPDDHARKREMAGILYTIGPAKEQQPKEGYFQANLIKRRQDLSLRSTVVPEPSLGLDQVGLPKGAAMELYKPFVVAKLRSQFGMEMPSALRAMQKSDPVAERALAEVLKERPLLLKRDPALHKFSVMAFEPVITSGKAIKIHPLVTGGFNADFDGDTMAGTVPVSQQAVQEARKLFPSKNLFSPTNYRVMYTPGHESLLGLYQLSKWGKESGVRVKDYEALRHLVEVGKVGHNDVVHVESVGSKPTTFGRLWMMHGVPRGFSLREQVLHDPSFELSKKPLGQVTDKLAREFPHEFDKAVNHLKDLGNEFSYKSGFSFGLKDFAPLPERDRILSEAKKKADALAKTLKDPRKRDQAIVEVYGKATEEIEAAAKKLAGTGNRLATMVYSGARGKPEQLRQMIAAPVLVQGHDGRTVLTPVTRSYAEGLDIGDFWTTQHGARKGTIQRTRGTSKPGELTKDIINSTISTMIVSEDCGTHHGVAMPIKNHKDIDTKDVVDRFLAHDVKLKDGSVLKAGAAITAKNIDQLRQVDDVVHVRSPLKCQHGSGLCAKCYGLNENGKLHPVGTNIGVLAGQALGEPATQLAMDAFHTGGLAAGRGGASGSRIERLQNLLKMPEKVKGQATLAKATGKITSIQPNKAIGGYDVVIEGHAHRVDDVRPDLKVGQMVQRGSSLSAPGAQVNPQQLLDITKDIHKVRNFLTKELHEGLYKSEGVRQRNVETVVRALTNLTRVKDPGSSHWEMGDIVPHSVVEEFNREHNGKKEHKPVSHEPILRGSGEIPHLSQDWISRLNYRNIRSTIQQAAATGAKSDIHGTNPLPGIARGSEFGPYPKVPPGKKPYVY